MPIQIDSHHHLWHYSEADYPWIGAGMDVLRRDYLPIDLKANLDAARVHGTVAVQARQTIEETRWLLELAGTSPFLHGVVGWVPLIDPGVRDTLEPLAADRHLKGVRHVLHDEPDDAYMLRDDFQRGVACLRSFGLVYDILIFARHLENTLAFVDRHPQQPFVVDHIAKPTITARAFDERWAAAIRELAHRDHVTCKLSGLVTEVRDPVWTPELIRPYYETVLEAFGPDRLMFGTDWPVCLLRTTYGVWVDTVRDLIRNLSPTEQAAMMGLTACRVYGLSTS
jgi:L-fuconolactonase